VAARRPGVGRQRGTVHGGERWRRFPAVAAEETGVDDVESGGEETVGRKL
jgi:hypothetical protein